MLVYDVFLWTLYSRYVTGFIFTVRAHIMTIIYSNNKSVRFVYALALSAVASTEIISRFFSSSVSFSLPLSLSLFRSLVNSLESICLVGLFSFCFAVLLSLCTSHCSLGLDDINWLRLIKSYNLNHFNVSFEMKSNPQGVCRFVSVY